MDDGKDDGTKIKLWVRSATGDFSTALVKDYNATHKNKVELTIIPSDVYIQKVATAAGAKQLPDLLAADVIYMPNYTTKGIYKDIAARINTLPYVKDLAPSHMTISTIGDKVFGVPHKVDASAFFWNKNLFKEAGLDPEKPPTTYQEVIDDAKKITALGGGKYGYYMGGNCGGCSGFTIWPNIWASGGDVMTPDGKTALFDKPQAIDAFSMYRQLWQDKSILPSAKEENGATWLNLFPGGKIGMQPIGSFAIDGLNKVKGLDYGVTGMPGKDGPGQTTFNGGDVLGLTQVTKVDDQAWNFLKWTVDEHAQVDIMAKTGNLLGRTDLNGNKYSTEPHVQAIMALVKQGHTPPAIPFGEIYNDPNGPWLAMVRDAIFGSGPVEEALKKGNAKIQAILDRS